MPNLLDRIGVDINQKLPLEAAVDWTIKHKVPFVDLCLDQTPELLRATESSRLSAARKRLEKAGAQLGLHTLSAVNIAETSPFVAKAADDYLAAYIDAAQRLGAGWIVVHGGHHFTSDKTARMDAAVARIARAARLAEKKKARILLENLNPEPQRAEVHYLCADLEECKYYFDRLDSPALGWSFT
ncbi:MAG TPA: TIM barrel protein, partial [Burkholderiales bacterium]|nr:TIM barrel protein [Burkholderiales bacterium]